MTSPSNEFDYSQFFKPGSGTILYVDIETDGLEPTEILCLVGRLEFQSGHTEQLCFRDLNGFFEFLTFTDAYGDRPGRVVFWNGVDFDIPVIKDLWGFDFDKVAELGIPIYDGLLLSRLIRPYRDLLPDKSPHSLEAYGKQLGFPKLSIDYDRIKEVPWKDLCDYALRDIEITAAAFKLLVEDARGGHFRDAYQLEYKVARSVNKQSQTGFGFDLIRALVNKSSLEEDMKRLYEGVAEFLPRVALPASKIKQPPRNQFKANGEPTKHAFNYFPNLRKAGPKWIFDHPEHFPGAALPWKSALVTSKQMEFSDTEQIKQYFLDLGWAPTLRTSPPVGGKLVGGAPKLYDQNKNLCPDLKRIAAMNGITWLPDLQKWLTYRHRVSAIEGYIKNRGFSENGTYYIRTPANTLGARTGRMTHKIVANVPRTTSLAGRELRELFIPRSPDHKNVGWDAHALEAFIEAHHISKYDRSSALLLTDGTIHDRNAGLLGVDRDTAKTFKYAVTYGARPPRIAETLGINLIRAQELYDTFWDQNQGLRALKEELEGFWERSHSDTRKRFIIGLDGRRLYPRSKHAIMNTLFQGDGAIFMKTAQIIMEEYPGVQSMMGAKLAFPMIRYHDEEQWSVHKDFAPLVGGFGVESLKDASNRLGLEYIVKGEYKIGNSWADTH